MELLLEWNEKVNLTAITEPKEIVEKHFLDSLSLLPACSIKQGAKVIDVGTGAGFPGIPLKIMRPDIQLTLLDGLNKRLIFLEEVCKVLELSSTRIHKRAEEAGLDKNLRESFDVATARAVASLPVLCEYCLPLVKMKGLFIAMTGISFGSKAFFLHYNQIPLPGTEFCYWYQLHFIASQNIQGIFGRLQLLPCSRAFHGYKEAFHLYQRQAVFT